jgi:8-amino-7-oxononanoate synthase
MEQTPDPPARLRTAAASREPAGLKRILRARPIGPRGRGAVRAAGLAAGPGTVRTITLSKTLESRDGAVPGAPDVIKALIDTGRSFIVDTEPVQGSVATAPAAVDILHNQPELSGHVRTRAREQASMARALGLETNDPAGAVVPIVLGPPQAALRAALICAERGVRAGCLRPPSVPVGRSFRRLTARANLGSDDLTVIRGALTVVAEMKVSM